MTIEAAYLQRTGVRDYTPAVAVESGLVIRLADGLAAVVGADLLASQQGGAFTEGVFAFACAAATVCSEGEEIWWDDTNNLAVVAGNANASFRIGTAFAAKSATGTYDTTIRVDLNAVNGLAAKSVIVADSAALSNTVTETVLATHTIPAGALKQGLIIDFLAALVATATNGTDTFQFRVRLGGLAGTVVADSTAIDLANADVAVLRGQILIREDGASGTFVAGSQSQMKTTSNPTVVQSTAIDTTAAVTLVVTGVESVASASNSAKAVAFNVEHK